MQPSHTIRSTAYLFLFVCLLVFGGFFCVCVCVFSFLNRNWMSDVAPIPDHWHVLPLHSPPDPTSSFSWSLFRIVSKGTALCLRQWHSADCDIQGSSCYSSHRSCLFALDLLVFFPIHKYILILSYLSHSLADGWGTTVDFITSFLLSLQFSAFRSIFHSKPVHSLMLSSRHFLCLSLCLLSWAVPCRIVLASKDDHVMCMYHFSLRLFIGPPPPSHPP